MKQYAFKTDELEHSRPIYNADGTAIKGGIKQSVTGIIETKLGKSRQTFAVSDIGKDDIIIGLDWIKRENPIIHWKEEYMTSKGRRAQIFYRSTKDQANTRRIQQMDKGPWRWRYNKATKMKQWYNTRRKQWYTLQQARDNDEWLQWYDEESEDERLQSTPAGRITKPALPPKPQKD